MATASPGVPPRKRQSPATGARDGAEIINAGWRQNHRREGAVPVALLYAAWTPVDRAFFVTCEPLTDRLSGVALGTKNGSAGMPAIVRPGPRTSGRVETVSALLLDIAAKTRTDPETGIKTVSGHEPPEVAEMVAALELLR